MFGVDIQALLQQHPGSWQVISLINVISRLTGDYISFSALC